GMICSATPIPRFCIFFLTGPYILGRVPTTRVGVTRENRSTSGRDCEIPGTARLPEVDHVLEHNPRTSPHPHWGRELPVLRSSTSVAEARAVPGNAKFLPARPVRRPGPRREV